MIYSYNFTNKIIGISELQSNVSVIGLLSDIREAEATAQGIGYGQIASASGGESLGGAVSVGVTLNLLDSWQVQFAAGNYIAKIAGGNLVGGLAGDPVAYSVGVQVLLLQSAASTVVTNSTGSGLSVDEHNQLFNLPTTGTTVPANIVQVHGQTISGTGSEADPWGPV